MDFTQAGQRHGNSENSHRKVSYRADIPEDSYLPRSATVSFQISPILPLGHDRKNSAYLSNEYTASRRSCSLGSYATDRTVFPAIPPGGSSRKGVSRIGTIVSLKPKLCGM
ncbi:hypothetical protein KM043_013515 [Ampulex compressa]|nr:hypothetical protein KM043_013515 [Ampulex compressa]